MALPRRQGVCSWAVNQLSDGVELRAAVQGDNAAATVVSQFPVDVNGIIERLEAIGWSDLSISFDVKILDAWGVDWLRGAVGASPTFSPIGTLSSGGSNFVPASGAVQYHIGGRPWLHWIGESQLDYGTVRITIRNLR